MSWDKIDVPIKKGKVMTNKVLKAGAAKVDITPDKSLFLYGYPHVERYSQGIHDPLYASALVLDNSIGELVFCTVDLINISKYITKKVRAEITQKCGIPKKNIMISATHTHSGPRITEMLSSKHDKVVPPADKEYVEILIEKISRVITQAYNNKVECEMAMTIADGKDIGGNRRKKGGLADPEVPVMVLRKKQDKQIYGILSIYCMHPTVLHEDSKLYSADFPGYTREYLLDKLGRDIVYLYHTGPEGNQSPRHYVKSTTFDEAKRLGYMLGERIYNKVLKVEEGHYKSWLELKTISKEVDFPAKQMPGLEEADKNLEQAVERLERLRQDKAPKAEIRTAECGWFGAEEMVTLARCRVDGKLTQMLEDVLPAEIQVFKVNEAFFVNVPGELFVEYSLRIKEPFSGNVFVTCLANGELQGYIVTREAVEEGGYEASNSLFGPEAGDIIVRESINLINKIS